MCGVVQEHTQTSPQTVLQVYFQLFWQYCSHVVSWKTPKSHLVGQREYHCRSRHTDELWTWSI